MTSTTQDGGYKTTLYKLKCKTLTECMMTSRPRCAEDGNCASDTPMEIAVVSDQKVWPYTAFSVEDDTFQTCSKTHNRFQM